MKLSKFKINASLIILLLSPLCMLPQMWSWETGPGNGQGQPLIYGVKGISSPLNSPGDISESVSWTDKNGNFWLFGGYSLSTASRGDLWKFNPTNREWTWVNGPGADAKLPVYGTVGVPSSTNYPGCRRVSAKWTDNSGNLWLYGGINFLAGGCADLWKYTTSTDQWTWVSGPMSPLTNNGLPVFGTQGVASFSTNPGAVQGSITWTDNNGDFWLFGGSVPFSSTSYGYSDNLWKYSISANQWTWIKGSGTMTPTSSFGTINISSASNQPPARTGGSGWVSPAGDLFLFGGLAAPVNNNYNMLQSDLWKYNISSGNWTWVGGSPLTDQTGVYGTMNLPSTSNIPGARDGFYAWTDTHGDFWMFGGMGHASTSGSHKLNDLWKYSPVAGTWSWVKGSNTTDYFGNYGIKGVPDFANNPPARSGGPSWIDINNNLWLYSGLGTGSTTQICEMWKFSNCTEFDSASNLTPVNNLNICGNLSATLAAVSGSSAVNWFNSPISNTVLFTGDTLVTSPLLAPNSTSVYTFYAEPKFCPSGIRTAVNVTVSQAPVITLTASATQICIGQSATLTAAGANSYTWSNSATTASIIITPTISDTYSVSSTGDNGCSGSAAITVSVNCIVGISELADKAQLTIYPNPAQAYLIIESSASVSAVDFTLFNNQGLLILSGEIFDKKSILNINSLAKGLYFLNVRSGSGDTIRRKIIIE